MNKEQFVTEQAMREEIQLQIFDIMDDIELGFSVVTIRLEKAIPGMSIVNMRKILASLQTLKRQITETKDEASNTKT